MTGSTRKSVLVVDDDPDICEALRITLEAYGCRVVTAESGAAALDKLRRGEDPCVILLDLMMPVMDGAQFRGEQLKDPALAAIPVVILSADCHVDSKAAALGTEGLAKPIDLDRLIEAIERFGALGGEAGT